MQPGGEWLRRFTAPDGLRSASAVRGTAERDLGGRLAVHPVDELVRGKSPHAGRVPGEVGVVEEVAPLATCPAAEECGGVDPVPSTAGDGCVGPPAHRVERRRLDQAGPSVLVDMNAEA